MSGIMENGEKKDGPCFYLLYSITIYCIVYIIYIYIYIYTVYNIVLNCGHKLSACTLLCIAVLRSRPFSGADTEPKFLGGSGPASPFLRQPLTR